MVKACVENGTHHLDISGEPLVCYIVPSSVIKRNERSEEENARQY